MCISLDSLNEGSTPAEPTWTPSAGDKVTILPPRGPGDTHFLLPDSEGVVLGTGPVMEVATWDVRGTSARDGRTVEQYLSLDEMEPIK